MNLKGKRRTLFLLLAVVVSGVLVGFAEETLFRGFVLRALREGGRAESSAALWTAVCFGLFHLPNVLMGTGAVGVIQVFIAALSDSVLYVFRRHTGRFLIKQRHGFFFVITWNDQADQH